MVTGVASPRAEDEGLGLAGNAGEMNEVAEETNCEVLIKGIKEIYRVVEIAY